MKLNKKWNIYIYLFWPLIIFNLSRNHPQSLQCSALNYNAIWSINVQGQTNTFLLTTKFILKFLEKKRIAPLQWKNKDQLINILKKGSDKIIYLLGRNSSLLGKAQCLTSGLIMSNKPKAFWFYVQYATSHIFWHNKTHKGRVSTKQKIVLSDSVFSKINSIFEQWTLLRMFTQDDQLMCKYKPTLCYWSPALQCTYNIKSILQQWTLLRK